MDKGLPNFEMLKKIFNFKFVVEKNCKVDSA